MRAQIARGRDERVWCIFSQAVDQKPKAAEVDQRARHRWIAAHILPYEAEVRGWLRRRVHTLSRADADDLIQEAYARLWLADFSKVVNGRGYLYAVVRNLLLEHARRARIVPMERLGEIEALCIPHEDPGPERQVTARQELERVVAIIDALPEQSRRAFRLQKFGGLSQREIAQAMKISEKTVEKHLAGALRRLLEALTKESGPAGAELGVSADDAQQTHD